MKVVLFYNLLFFAVISTYHSPFPKIFIPSSVDKNCLTKETCYLNF